MNHYISTHITKHIDSYLNQTGKYEFKPWEIQSHARKALEHFGLFSELREAMKPYYEMLMKADSRFGLSKDNKLVMGIVTDLFLNDCVIGKTMNNLDIVDSALRWGKKSAEERNPPYTFFLLLKHLIKTGYDPGWDAVEKDVRGRLKKAHEFGDYWRLEMYCIIMAFRLVMKSNLSDTEKDKKYDEIRDRWDFLRYMYSMMLGVIVGLKSENFAAVASSLAIRKKDYGYMHLAYKAFKENFDKLCPPLLKDSHTGELIRDQAVIHLQKMEDIIKSTPPENDIVPLLEILFSKKMKAVLAHDRPKTYEELEKDIESLTQSYDDVVRQMAQGIRQMAQGMEDAISIESLTEAFLRFPCELAMALFQSVHNLLAQDKVWQKYQAEIQQKILAKYENKGETQINNVFNKGSVTMNAGSSINGDVNIS